MPLYKRMNYSHLYKISEADFSRKWKEIIYLEWLKNVVRGAKFVLDFPLGELLT